MARPNSWNRYAYVEGDPVNYYDPSGLLLAIPGDDTHSGGVWDKVSGGFDPTFGGWLFGGVSPGVPEPPERPEGGGTPVGPQIPALPGGTPQDRVRAFNAAYAEAWTRLSREQCAKLFEPTTDLARFALASPSYSFQPLGRPSVDQNGNARVTGAATFADKQTGQSTVFINSQGPFLNQMLFVPGQSGLQTLDFGTNLRGAEFGALLLLHELGHVVGIFGADRRDQDLNRSYTQQVLDGCFPKQK